MAKTLKADGTACCPDGYSNGMYNLPCPTHAPYGRRDDETPYGQAPQWQKVGEECKQRFAGCTGKVERQADQEGARRADEEALAALQAALPGWRVWQSEYTGSYGAQRDRFCLMSSSPEELAKKCLEYQNAGTCRRAGCERPATEEYGSGWWVCETCHRSMSQ